MGVSLHGRRGRGSQQDSMGLFASLLDNFTKLRHHGWVNSGAASQIAEFMTKKEVLGTTICDIWTINFHYSHVQVKGNVPTWRYLLIVTPNCSCNKGKGYANLSRIYRAEGHLYSGTQLKSPYVNLLYRTERHLYSGKQLKSPQVNLLMFITDLEYLDRSSPT